MSQLMFYAHRKGLITIMDAKRGDIMDTQTQMAMADIGNFAPDIVTLHSYSGSDAVKPYLDADPKVCAYIMGAMSNPSAKIQGLNSDGIHVAVHVALDAHKWGEGLLVRHKVTHKNTFGWWNVNMGMNLCQYWRPDWENRVESR